MKTLQNTKGFPCQGITKHQGKEDQGREPGPMRLSHACAARVPDETEVVALIVLASTERNKNKQQAEGPLTEGPSTQESHPDHGTILTEMVAILIYQKLDLHLQCNSNSSIPTSVFCRKRPRCQPNGGGDVFGLTLEYCG